ncbi:MAG: hypothetical protein ACKO23_21325 [Gemmataceae bacterium]
MFGAPAYIRRARLVEEALNHLLLGANKQRKEWLEIPRMLLGQLHALAGDWRRLRPFVEEETQLVVLDNLCVAMEPRLRLSLERSNSSRRLKQALLEFVNSLERFNHRWMNYLNRLDVHGVNQLRENYNRWYVLEKACALRNDVLARLEFTPLLPLDLEELLHHLPLIPVPRLRR